MIKDEGYESTASGRILLSKEVRTALAQHQADKAKAAREEADVAWLLAEQSKPSPENDLWEALREAGVVFSADGLDYRSGLESFCLELIDELQEGNEEAAQLLLKHFPAQDVAAAMTALAKRIKTIDFPPVKDALTAMQQDKATQEVIATGRALKIFDVDRLLSSEVKNRVGASANDIKRQMQNAHANAKRNKGYRVLPELTEPLKALADTDESFENFRSVIAELVDNLTLSQHQKPEGFRVRPILMNGVPGIGKTAFAYHVGQTLGIPFEKVSAAGLQNGFVLCGSAKQWGNSAPGLVFNLLSESEYATGVLLIDEVDKIARNEQYNVLAALLDLLEPESARKYKDESADIVFDASRLIILMTSNSTESIDEALLSRCMVAEISEPHVNQRLAVMQSVFDELKVGLQSSKELILDLEAAMDMANASLGLRDLNSAVRKAFVAALRDGSDIVRPVPDGFSRKEKMPVGFIH